MRVLDSDGNEVEQWQGLGHLVQETIVKTHHEAQGAVDAVEEQWHYEIVAQYPNGGKDVRKVVDVPAVEAQAAVDAWDEYEDILRFTPYTDEELAAMEEAAKETLEARVAEMEAFLEKIRKILKVPLAALSDEEET